jgi:hypothetical protein
VELLVSILALGSTYALLAAGIVIIYKASRVINFAHGELAIVGAYVFHSAGFLTGTTLTALSLFASIAIAAAASAFFGVVIYFALMRRLLGRPTFVAAMVTIGLAIILKAAIVVIWNSRSVGIPIGRQALYNFAGGGRITWIDVISVLTCVAAFGALAIFFQLTRLGRQFRGAAENPLLAAQRQSNSSGCMGRGGVLRSAGRRLVRLPFDAEPAKHHHRAEWADCSAGRRPRQPARRGAWRSPRSGSYLSYRATNQPNARRNCAVSNSLGRHELAALGIVRHGRRD